MAGRYVKPVLDKVTLFVRCHLVARHHGLCFDCWRGGVNLSRQKVKLLLACGRGAIAYRCQLRKGVLKPSALVRVVVFEVKPL